MTITCPVCSQSSEIVPESTLGDWHATACPACEANFVLIKSSLSPARTSPSTGAAKTRSRWSAQKA